MQQIIFTGIGILGDVSIFRFSRPAPAQPAGMATVHQRKDPVVTMR